MIPLGVLGSAHVSAGGGDLPLTSSYLGAYALAPNATSHTFPTVNLGTASSDRNIVVAVGTLDGSVTPSAVTIAGVSATLDVARVTAPPYDGTNSVSIWRAAVPTGTSGSVVVTWTGTAVRAFLGAWAITGASSITPTDTATGVNSVTLDGTPVTVAAAYNTSINAVEWTNATLDALSPAAESNSMSLARANVADEPVTITVTTASGSSFINGTAAVSYRSA